MDGPVGFEDDLVEVPIVGFTALSERLREGVRVEPGTLEVAGDEAAVVDEEHG